MENEQVAALHEKFDKLGFPREDADFKSKVKTAVLDALETGQPQKFEHKRKRADFEITVAPGRNDDSKVFVNQFIVNNSNKTTSLRFPTGNSQPTMKAMENAVNGSWIKLKDYQPKDKTKEANDVWFRIHDGNKEFVSTQDFDLKAGKEVLGYRLTAEDVKQMERGNDVLTNDCLRYEKGSNTPVGKNPNTVSLYADAGGNRVGYKDLGKTLDLKKNKNPDNDTPSAKNGVDVKNVTAKAAANSTANSTTVTNSKKNNR